MRTRALLATRKLVMALALAAASNVEASSIYTVVDFGRDVSDLHLNNVGQVAGIGANSTGFLYTDGQYSALTTGVQPIAVTDSGQVIDARGPFSYYSGSDTLSGLVSPGPAVAGNQNGVLVGTGIQRLFDDNDNNPVAYVYQPVAGLQPKDNSQYFISHNDNNSLWPILAPGDPTGQGHMNSLPLAQLTAINNSNQVAGSYAPSWAIAALSTSPWHAFTATVSSGPNGDTQTSTLKDLGTLGGKDSFAEAISNSGEVVGGSQAVNGAFHAFAYVNGKMSDLGVLPGLFDSVALGVNDKGQVVGASTGSTANLLSSVSGTDSPTLNTYLPASHAFLYSDGVMEDLNDRLPATLGLTLDRAYAIDDAGQILVSGHGADGIEHEYLLSPTPVPEPTTLALLGLTAAGYGLRLRRNSKPAGH